MAKVFCTQWKTADGLFNGYVIEEDWPSAQRAAPPGHEVIGELVSVIPADRMDVEISADAVMAGLLAEETVH